MAIWGVLRLPDGSASHGVATGEGAAAAALAGCVDGVVALTHDASLADALRSLPASVTQVVVLAAVDAASGEPGRTIAALVAGLDDEHAAVAAARPVADALKRVEDGVVVGGLARDGLLMPCLPHAYRRSSLESVLAAAEGATDDDALGLLIAAGHAVRLVPPDGAPITVRGPA
jgi:2-C-methyl-D-erythritol 4-phosphate cytidylyltransferase